MIEREREREIGKKKKVHASVSTAFNPSGAAFDRKHTREGEKERKNVINYILLEYI
jgi:hypothetical protein